MTDLYTLGLEVRSDGVVVASNRLNQLAKDGKNAEDSTKKLSTATSSLVNYMKAAAAALGLYKLAEYAKESALLAARYQTLGVVMNTVGATAGYTNAQMSQFEKTLQKQGIAMVESRQVLTQMAQAHLDLAKSSELARVAQDAATIGGINSSEAFERMVSGIQKGETEILKTIGINVNFEQSYVKMAATLGKSKDALTETEKSTARMNAVLERGKDIAGVYEAAMGTAGKQLTSMKRYSDNLKVTLGSVFNDALIVGVSAFTKGLKEANTEAEKLQEQNKLAEAGKTIVMAIAAVADGLRIVVLAIQTVGVAIGATAAKVYFAFNTISSAIRGDFQDAKNSLDSLLSVNSDAAKNIQDLWKDPTKFQDAAKAMYMQREANKERDDAQKKILEARQKAAGLAAKEQQEADALRVTVEKNREDWNKIVVAQLESSGQYTAAVEKQIELNKLTADYVTLKNTADKDSLAAAAFKAQELADQQKLLDAKRKELDLGTDHEKTMLGIEASKLAIKGMTQDQIYLETGIKQAMLEERILQNQIATEVNPIRKSQMQEQLDAQSELNRLTKEEVEQRIKAGQAQTKQTKDKIDEYNASISISRTQDEQYANDKYITTGFGRLESLKFNEALWFGYVQKQAQDRIDAYERNKREEELIEYQKEMIKSIQDAADSLSSAATTLANSGRSLAESLRASSRSIQTAQVDIAGGSVSTLTPEQKYLLAKQLFVSTAAQAQSTGDSELFSQLPDLARKMLEASMAYSGSTVAYTQDYNTVQAILTESASQADIYATAAETIATLLEQQSVILTAIKTALETGGDTANLLSSLYSINNTINGTLGTVNTSVGSVTSATNTVNSSIGSNTTATTSGTSTLSGYLNNVQSYTNNTASYTNSTQSALNNSLLNSELKGRISGVVDTYTYNPNSSIQIDHVSSAYSYYAKGGIANDPSGHSVFGEAGPEAAVPLPDGRTIPVTLTHKGAADNRELVAELRASREEMHLLRAEVRAVAKNTRDTSRQLERWDGDGMPDVRNYA